MGEFLVALRDHPREGTGDVARDPYLPGSRAVRGPERTVERSPVDGVPIISTSCELARITSVPFASLTQSPEQRAAQAQRAPSTIRRTAYAEVTLGTRGPVLRDE